MTINIFVYIVSCPSLTDPNNGVMTCSLGDDGVPSYKDTCTFICNVGYLLTGSDFRTCQSDGSWSGTETMCRKGEICVCICFNCVQIKYAWHLAPVKVALKQLYKTFFCDWICENGSFKLPILMTYNFRLKYQWFGIWLVMSNYIWRFVKH